MIIQEINPFAGGLVTQISRASVNAWVVGLHLGLPVFFFFLDLLADTLHG